MLLRDPVRVLELELCSRGTLQRRAARGGAQWAVVEVISRHCAWRRDSASGRCGRRGLGRVLAALASAHTGLKTFLLTDMFGVTGLPKIAS